MYKKYSRKGKKRYSKKKKTVRKAVRRARNNVFKKRVMSVIAKAAETKQAFANVQQTAFGNAISTSADVMPCVPSISRGITDNARIGDQITAKSLTIKGYVNLPLQNLANVNFNRRVAIKIFCVSPKRFPTYTDASTNASLWMPSLLRKGGTTVGFTGVISDLWAPVNTDAITKYWTKTIYLRQDWIWANGTPAAGAVTTMTNEGTVKFFSKSWRFGKGKKIKYDDNIDAGINPTNFDPIMVVGLVYLDGTVPDNSNQAYISYDAIFNYEDA